MIRCRSCDHSRWVYVKSGALADDLEWLTGFIRYRCEACGRAGWHRTRQRPPALHDILRAFTVLSRVKAAAVAAMRVGVTAVVGTSRRLAATTDWRLVALGLAAAVMLFTGFAIGAGRSSPIPTDSRASPSLAQLTPAKQAAPAPEPERPQAAVQVPLSRVQSTHVSPASEERPGKATTPPKSSPRQVARVTAARDVGGSKRRPSPTPAVHPKPDATAPKPAADKAVDRKASPPAPRFHGSLAVLSEPLGAVVTVDGRVVGTTPVVLKAVPVGSRVVRIESQGYERWSSAVRVVANQEVRIVAALQRGAGQ